MHVIPARRSIFRLEEIHIFGYEVLAEIFIQMFLFKDQKLGYQNHQSKASSR